MFNKVLVGVDDRLGGRDAIALASQLTAPDGALILARVYTGRYMPSHAVTPGLVNEERTAAKESLEHARANASVDAKLVLVEAPSPGRGLHGEAEDDEADLLVVGSSHRGSLGRAMLGDDTRGALDGAPCAVAVAPRAYAERPRPFATIGVGYDGSSESTAAIEVAKALAKRTSAKVRALQVVAIPPYTYAGAIGALGPVLEGIDDLVKQAANRATMPGVDGSAEFGLPGEELAAFSAEVDLLIVGSRGYGPLHRMISGSTSRYLQRHARAPLLVLPRGTEYAKLQAGEG
jgi:nucleotide-binding universal stress UspA family protein